MIGRRPRMFEVDDIIRVGRELGMRRLSMNAVAAELGVSSTALYRAVDGRWGLERLVGESLLGDLKLHDDPDHDIEQHLLSFGLQMWHFIVRHPGLGVYMQILFPRGEAGRLLMAHQIEALSKRGYSPDVAIALSSVIAGVSINYAVAEDSQREHADELDAQRQEVTAQLKTDEDLAEAHRNLPSVEHTQFVRLVLAAMVRGVVSVAPPGRPLDQVMAELAAMGMGI
ncbi:TetR/AcrR family transcriptional regulator [Rhodococcus sp. HM1]|uniref:TetR/AcrR family transcriptional regulator n=1 Tax=Rhodococcus sp. HM1 TaxID=2937759 RepID=UPI00200A8B07|nr:TetR/AcrR family transcriptional regulator [Rhodococcus sp. HM1]MCK8671652.1 TetR/AcrR family transcriptional regulator [Rhodococcus sp. HM1]